MPAASSFFGNYGVGGKLHGGTRMQTTSFRSRLFWFISRTAHVLYHYFPVFGRIRGSIAIIRRDGGFVVIERNDGFGLGFPGGIARFHENPEVTVRREVAEETGLKILSVDYKFNFNCQSPFPTLTHVFEATADGQLRGSWEGTPQVVSFEELQRRIVPQQRQVISYLLSRAQQQP